MTWTVHFSRQVQRAQTKLPKSMVQSLTLLAREIEILGPVRGNWPNYSILKRGQHHCHLKKGKPTYVAVWVEKDREIKLVEVIYAGTHEKAPY